AAIYRVAGVGNFSAVIAVQSLLGALVPVAIYLIARRIGESQPAALAVGLVCAVHKVLIFLAGVLGMEALYIPLAYIGLTWLMSEPRRLVAYFGIGVVLGLANGARNELFAFPFVLLLVTAIVR